MIEIPRLEKYSLNSPNLPREPGQVPGFAFMAIRVRVLFPSGLKLRHYPMANMTEQHHIRKQMEAVIVIDGSTIHERARSIASYCEYKRIEFLQDFSEYLNEFLADISNEQS